VWIVEAPSPAWLEALSPQTTPSGQRVAVTGANTCVIEDTVVSASIAARVFTAEEWRAALSPHWETTVERAGAFEWLIVARRAGA
jgi:hypothetical protein